MDTAQLVPLPAEVTVELWERQLLETPKQYAYFCAYRDLGPTRTLANAAVRFNSGGSRTRVRWFQKLSTRHQWRRRAEAWDAHQDRLARQAQENAVVQMNTRHAQIGLEMQSRGLGRLKNLTSDELSPKETRSYLVDGMRAERAARLPPASEKDKEKEQASPQPAQVTVNLWGDIDARVQTLAVAIEERFRATLIAARGAATQGNGEPGAQPERAGPDLPAHGPGEPVDPGKANGEAGGVPPH